MFVPRSGPRYTEEEARRAVAESKSWAETLRNLGMCTSGGAAPILRKYVEIWGISTDHFDPYASQRGKRNPLRPLSEVLVENSTYSRGNLKERLFREGYKPRYCELCGQGEEWQGRRMSLILDHVNGIGNDNRFQNLRIVCPNCAATLDTHCGRGRATPRERECLLCGKPFRPRYATHRYCSPTCGQRSPGPTNAKPEIRKVDRPPYARLKREVGAMGYSAVGRRYGVSDNAVRKWIQWYEAEMERAGRADGMKRFRCEQVIAGCDATFEAPDEDGILRQVVVHAREAHGMDEVPPEVADRVLAGVEGTSEEGPPAPAA
jgi:predicted small metal-binding protein